MTIQRETIKKGVKQHIMVSTCTTFRIGVPYLAYEICSIITAQ